MIKLVQDATESDEYPEYDKEAEGINWLAARGYLIDGRDPRELWAYWQECRPLLYVVRFQLVESYE